MKLNFNVIVNTAIGMSLAVILTEMLVKPAMAKIGTNQ